MKLLTNRSVAQRFTAAGLLAMLFGCLAGAALLRTQWVDMRTAQTESQGLPASASVLRLIQMTQQHRGLSAGMLAGNEAFVAKREAKQREVTAALTLAQEATLTWQTPSMTRQREALTTPWATLAEAVAAKEISGPDSFSKHTALIRQQLNLLDEIVSASTLALDPEADAYYLIQVVLADLPEATEVMGQLRARGSALIAKKEISAADRVNINQLLNLAQARFDRTQVNLERAVAANPEDLAATQTTFTKTGVAVRAAQRFVQEQLLVGEAPTASAEAYFTRLTEAIDAQFALSQDVFERLQGTLAAREQLAKRAMVAELLGMSLLAVLTALWIVSVRRGISKDAASALATARNLAQGDFTLASRSLRGDEFGQIARAMEEVRAAMASAVTQVRDGVHAVALSSNQIAHGNMELAERTESQSSALQETAASMEEITGNVGQSSRNAQSASELAASASASAETGGQVVGEVVATMREIAASSQRMAEIIGVIDSIAFQTNILALNAAVEAARAGEQGRGFAVVASEVRSLAQRSADAAKEIKEMISSSVSKVEAGTRLADGAGHSMTDIVAQVRKVTELINEISASASDQSASLTQVNAAVSQMEQNVQRNAAHVQESATAAEEMRCQAQKLSASMSMFKLR
jgi:methyl-accepting chemotaxis protein